MHFQLSTIVLCFMCSLHFVTKHNCTRAWHDFGSLSFVCFKVSFFKSFANPHWISFSVLFKIDAFLSFYLVTKSVKQIVSRLWKMTQLCHWPRGTKNIPARGVTSFLFSGIGWSHTYLHTYTHTHTHTYRHIVTEEIWNLIWGESKVKWKPWTVSDGLGEVWEYERGGKKKKRKEAAELLHSTDVCWAWPASLYELSFRFNWCTLPQHNNNNNNNNNNSKCFCNCKDPPSPFSFHL